MSTSQSDINRIQAAVSTSLHAHWRLFFFEGLVLLCLGGAAIVLPLIATVAVPAAAGPPGIAPDEALTVNPAGRPLAA